MAAEWLLLDDGFPARGGKAANVLLLDVGVPVRGVKGLLLNDGVPAGDREAAIGLLPEEERVPARLLFDDGVVIAEPLDVVSP